MHHRACRVRIYHVSRPGSRQARLNATFAMRFTCTYVHHPEGPLPLHVIAFPHSPLPLPTCPLQPRPLPSSLLPVPLIPPNSRSLWLAASEATRALRGGSDCDVGAVVAALRDAAEADALLPVGIAGVKLRLVVPVGRADNGPAGLGLADAAGAGLRGRLRRQVGGGDGCGGRKLRGESGGAGGELRRRRGGGRGALGGVQHAQGVEGFGWCAQSLVQEGLGAAAGGEEGFLEDGGRGAATTARRLEGAGKGAVRAGGRTGFDGQGDAVELLVALGHDCVQGPGAEFRMSGWH